MRIFVKPPAVMMLAALAASVAADPKATIEVVRDTTYSATSVEARSIREWLQDHTASVDGVELGSIHRNGEFRVVHRQHHDADRAGRSFDPPPLPVPLPGSGAPGEVIELTHATPGVSIQTWTYEWVSNSTGGGWLLIDYSYTRDRLRTPETGH
ncbi:hypothetical protein WCE41_09920 [Luteimonas sp. MJ246]|uniref:hypothetical protein n=1 Tax=Luteimonas sp. MJ174 TaxID=3129237 RepID=UPI0031BB1CD5